MSTTAPDPNEIRKEISEFLKDKYQGQVVMPQQDEVAPPPTGEENKNADTKLHFDLKPEELEAYLEKYVVNQEEAIEILATKICTHFNRMNFELNANDDVILGNIKSNVIMIGPTGVGKTYLVKLIANKLGVPFVKGDATKFSETGYVGGDVEELIRELVREAKGDIQLAEYGIVYLDEIDKIASSGGAHGPDVSRTGVQRNLLKLMEESEVELRPPHDLASQMEAVMEAQRSGKVERKKINTRNILFVVSGAFAGLPDIIQRRMNQKALGFQSDPQIKRNTETENWLRYTKSEDLMEYGFESEFIGRLPVLAVLNTLDEKALFRIVTNPKSSVVRSKKRDFLAYGIEIDFAEDALAYLAKQAFGEKTGARGLTTVFERALLKYEKKLPSTNIQKLTITREMVENPEAELKKVLISVAVKTFQREFLERTGIVITFASEARDLVLEQAEKNDRDFVAECQEIFSDYEYGLRLVKLSQFSIDADTIRTPKKKLEELIRLSYHSDAE